jgi:hypothetical protein
MAESWNLYGGGPYTMESSTVTRHYITDPAIVRQRDSYKGAMQQIARILGDIDMPVEQIVAEVRELKEQELNGGW